MHSSIEGYITKKEYQHPKNESNGYHGGNYAEYEATKINEKSVSIGFVFRILQRSILLKVDKHCRIANAKRY